MKIPLKPPDTNGLVKKFFSTNLEKAIGLIQDMEPVDHKGRYLHWDKLRHLEPPNELNSEMWWMGIKFARQKLYKDLYFYDRYKRNFKIALPDCVLKDLHWLDVNCAGSVGAEIPLNNPQMKNQYLIKSLVEEAISSSQLEGASTTRNVAKEMIRQGRKPQNKDERMIYNNYNAMQFIKEFKDEPLTPSVILELHQILTEKTLDNPGDSGRYRNESDDIHVVDGQGGILHTPPNADQIPDRINRICKFANERESEIFIHPIIRAILLHFMLAYDHPFVDGNGRTARALFYWSVASRGYWVMEYITISRIIKQAPAQYGRAFLFSETDDNDTTYFIIHQLDVIKRAIYDFQSFIDKKISEIKSAESLLTSANRLKGKLNHRQLSLLRHAIKHPGNIYQVKEHQNTHGIVYDTARTDLIKMADLNLLIKRKSGKSFIFIAPTDLEERIKSAK